MRGSCEPLIPLNGCKGTHFLRNLQVFLSFSLSQYHKIQKNYDFFSATNCRMAAIKASFSSGSWVEMRKCPLKSP